MSLASQVGALATAIGAALKTTRSDLATLTTKVNRNVKSSTSLAYAATRSVDASSAPRQVIALSGNMTVSAPTNPTDGQDLRLEFVASGAGPWTVTLTTGAAGAFAFGTDLTALPTVATGKTLYVLATYNLTAARWRVLSATGGF